MPVPSPDDTVAKAAGCARKLLIVRLAESLFSLTNNGWGGSQALGASLGGQLHSGVAERLGARHGGRLHPEAAHPCEPSEQNPSG